MIWLKLHLFVSSSLKNIKIRYEFIKRISIIKQKLIVILLRSSFFLVHQVWYMYDLDQCALWKTLCLIRGKNYIQIDNIASESNNIKSSLEILWRIINQVANLKYAHWCFTQSIWETFWFTQSIWQKFGILDLAKVSIKCESFINFLHHHLKIKTAIFSTFLKVTIATSSFGL